MVSLIDVKILWYYIYIYTHKCERTPFQVFKLKNILILISRYLNKKINKLFKFIHLNLSRFAIQNKKIYPNSDQLIIQKKTNATVRKLWKKNYSMEITVVWTRITWAIARIWIHHVDNVSPLPILLGTQENGMWSPDKSESGS